MANNKYLNLVTSEHKIKPKFMSWLTANLDLTDDMINILNEIVNDYDIDNAIGSQLDALGQLIGRNRVLNFQPTDYSAVLDDNYYRLALKAKIAQNQWDGTINQIYDMWKNTFKNLILEIIDNEDMSMTAVIQGAIDELKLLLIANGYIVPKPSGVGINYVSKSEMFNTTVSLMVVSQITQTQNEMTQPPIPIITNENYYSLIVSQSSQTHNDMIQPVPIIALQNFNKLSVSQIFKTTIL